MLEGTVQRAETGSNKTGKGEEVVMTKIRKVKVKEKDGRGDKTIGFLLKGTFISSRSEARHMFRNGVETYGKALKQKETYWGLDREAVEALHSKYKANSLLIIGTKTLYSIPLDVFMSKADVVDFSPHRMQYILHFDSFHKIPRNDTTDKGITALIKELQDAGVLKNTQK